MGAHVAAHAEPGQELFAEEPQEPLERNVRAGGARVVIYPAFRAVHADPQHVLLQRHPGREFGELGFGEAGLHATAARRQPAVGAVVHEPAVEALQRVYVVNAHISSDRVTMPRTIPPSRISAISPPPITALASAGDCPMPANAGGGSRCPRTGSASFASAPASTCVRRRSLTLPSTSARRTGGRAVVTGAAGSRCSRSTARAVRIVSSGLSQGTSRDQWGSPHGACAGLTANPRRAIQSSLKIFDT